MEMDKGGKRLHLLDSLLSGVIVLYATYLMRNSAGSKALLRLLFLLLAAERPPCVFWKASARRRSGSALWPCTLWARC